MKKIIRSVLLLVLSLTVLLIPALAADWPQFLGDPGAQGVSDGHSAVSGADLMLRWEKNTGNTWDDVPGTPIVMGGFLSIITALQYLRKLDLATGRSENCQDYGEPVNQFFIDIAFGDGMIFVAVRSTIWTTVPA